MPEQEARNSCRRHWQWSLGQLKRTFGYSEKNIEGWDIELAAQIAVKVGEWDDKGGC